MVSESSLYLLVVQTRTVLIDFLELPVAVGMHAMTVVVTRP